jgi:malonyl CoA-acyl carrier protein transacylase
MAPAQAAFHEALARAQWLPAVVPVISTRSGSVAGPGEAATLLEEQLTHPVEFERALSCLAALDTTAGSAAGSATVLTLVTVGPGAVLRSLARRNLGSTITILPTDDAAALQRTCETLRRTR